MPKVSQYVSVIGSAIVTIVTAFENLSPEAKTFLASELSSLETQLAAVKTALDAFASASTLGKISAGLSVLNVFGAVIVFVEATYQNGEKLFEADWQTIKGPIDSVLALFGVSGPATAQVGAAPAPAPETSNQPS
jgi:hypothetical protein